MLVEDNAGIPRAVGRLLWNLRARTPQ